MLNFKKVLLFLTISFTLQFNSSIAYSHPANKILIYTNTSNLTNTKDTDLILFFPGFGLWSAHIFTDSNDGGLSLIQGLTKTLPYKNNLIYASIDTSIMPSWGSKKATLDIQNDIKNILRLFKIRNIYLIGGSMGGSTALNLSSIADKEVKSKIKSILVYFPITDYSFTIKNMKDERIRTILYNHFYNDKNNKVNIIESSPITHVNSLPNNTKIKLIVGTEDKIAPPQQAIDYYLKAKKLGKNIAIEKVKAGHTSPEIKDVYKASLEEMLK